MRSAVNVPFSTAIFPVSGDAVIAITKEMMATIESRLAAFGISLTHCVEEVSHRLSTRAVDHLVAWWRVWYERGWLDQPTTVQGEGCTLGDRYWESTTSGKSR